MDVVNYMQDHSESFAPFMEEDQTFESYCKRMMQVGMRTLTARQNVSGTMQCPDQGGATSHS